MDENVEPDTSLRRRAAVRTAAWSVPVVSLAVAAPKAAASAAQAVIEATAGGSITANNSAGRGNGNLIGGMALTDVSGSWETGVLFAEVEGTGPWNTFQVSKRNGSAFVRGEAIVAGGVIWIVQEIESDGDGTWSVSFTAPSQTVRVNTSYTAPAVQFSGAFTPGVPRRRNPVAATIRVSAANVNGAATVSNAVSYP